ncbi:MAG: hypothetical protein GY854_13680 [Deltaproteobacteria bacterium]|nr:hypothetical protein [Deltaproteobacteria bacterium]
MTDTVTISMRLPRSEVGRLERAAKILGMDRATFLKMALRLGSADVLLDQVGSAYRRGEMTLSRAAEVAGISLYEMIAKMDQLDLELKYDLDDLEQDIPS